MRVTVVSRSTIGHRVGGLESYVHDMLVSLSGMNMDVKLVTADGASASYLQELSNTGVETETLDGVPSERYTNLWHQRLRDVTLVSDAVIFHGLAGLKCAPLSRGPRLISLTHGATPLAIYNAGLDGRPIRARVSRSAAYLFGGEIGMLRSHELVALSAYDAKMTRLSSGAIGKNITIIPPPIKPGLPGTRRENYILFAGRLQPSKGLPDLLKAWSAVRPSGYRLRVAGSGPLAHACEELTDIGIDYVGPLSTQGVRAEMARAKWSFAGGRYLESFGLSAAESMAVGTPVIYRARAALRETVGVGGLPFRSPRSLVAALALATEMESAQWESLSHTARTATEPFNPRHVRARWMEFLER